MAVHLGDLSNGSHFFHASLLFSRLLLVYGYMGMREDEFESSLALNPPVFSSYSSTPPVQLKKRGLFPLQNQHRCRPLPDV